MAWPWSEIERGRESLHRKRDRDTEFEEEEEKADGDGNGACCAVLLDVGINKPDLVAPHCPYLLLCSV